MLKLLFDKTQLEAIGAAAGLAELAKDYGFSYGFEGEGLPVSLQNTEKDILKAERRDGRAVLTFPLTRKVLFFRGVSLLLQYGEKDFCMEEDAYFLGLGAMLDLCQGNMALNMDTMKEFFRRQAFMGLGLCGMYMEDTFDVPEYPYFGYMRSRYTFEELRELDDYAYDLGIELVPFIQTLSHQSTVVCWDIFMPIRENHRTLLPEEEETYKFLRKVIENAAKPFRTKRIHLGMDETVHVGKGAYYVRHGDVPFETIILRHLKRVCAITEELGLIPMFWDDKRYAALDPAEFPADLQQLFASYFTQTEEWYDKTFTERRSDRGNLLYCPTVWSWLGFAPNWTLTVNNLISLKSCRRKNVREVFDSIWEIGQDCDFRVNLLGLQIFAEMAYGHSLEEVKERFRFCCGGDMDGLWLLHQLDEIPGVPEGNGGKYPSAATEFLLWQDPLCGLFDYDIDGLAVNAHFEALAEKLKPYAEAAKGTAWENFYEYYLRLANALALKSELGLNITKAYKADDKAALRVLADETIPETLRRIRALRQQSKENWLCLGKPLGWEVYDIHYGAILTRLESAMETVRDYLEGRRARLEELEEPRRSYCKGGKGYAGRIPAWTDKWGRMVSASRVSQEYWLKLPKAGDNDLA